MIIQVFGSLRVRAPLDVSKEEELDLVDGVLDAQVARAREEALHALDEPRQVEMIVWRGGGQRRHLRWPTSLHPDGSAKVRESVARRHSVPAHLRPVEVVRSMVEMVTGRDGSVQ